MKSSKTYISDGSKDMHVHERERDRDSKVQKKQNPFDYRGNKVLMK